MSVRKPPLRAVGPSEVPPVVPARVLSLKEAIESGDYLQILLAQRRAIADDLPEEKGPAKAAMHRQLSLLSKEIEALQRGGDDDLEGGANVEDGEFDAAAI